MVRRIPKRGGGGRPVGLEGVSLGGESNTYTPKDSGLVPIGDSGVWVTPNEPVSPTDCESWPDSPWCGGTGFNPGGTGLGIEVSANNCETCITVAASLASLSLFPPYNICSRDPKCNIKEPSLPPDKPVRPSSRFTPNGFAEGHGNCKYGILEERTLVRFVAGQGLGEYSLVEYKDTTPVTDEFGREYTTIRRGPILGYIIFNDGRDNFSTQIVTQEYLDLFWEDHLQAGYSYPYQTVELPDGSGVPTFRSGRILNIFRLDPLQDCPRYSPPPPYPKPPMSCCPEQMELLKLIARRLGTDNFPVSVPKSLIDLQPDSAVDNLKDVLSSETKPLEDVPSLFAWFVEQFDTVIGRFQVPIEIEDTDITEEGNQTAKIILPNVAETLGEIVGLLFQINSVSEALLNINTRGLIQTGATYRDVVRSLMLSQAIADHLDFEQGEDIVEVPLTFALPKEGEDVELHNLSKLLQNSVQKIKIIEKKDKRTLQDTLLDLSQAAAIIRAKYWRQIDPEKDVKNQILDILKRGASLLEENTSSEKEKTEFRDLLDNIERQYGTAGIGEDTANPYGRPYGERPKITELKTKADDDANQQPTP